MPKGQTLQDPYLNMLRKEHVPVSIYLVNGIKLQGIIESFDRVVVMLKDTVSLMVYKNAISTVVPSRVVPGIAEVRSRGASKQAAPDMDFREEVENQLKKVL